VCHHPFKPPATAPAHTRTARGIKASSLVAPSSIHLVLSGHVHGASADLQTYSTGSYLSLTSGTLSTRLREGQAAFNAITLGENEVAATAYRHSGKRFSPHPMGEWRIGPKGIEAA